METIKLTPEELQKIQELQQQINQNVFELGQTSVQIYNISEALKQAEKQKSEIISLLQTLSQHEADNLKELEGKYGKGQIDVATGEIKPF